MKKFPKLVQIDKRGQIVIPKDIRQELGLDEGDGFWVYSIEKEGILLKKISAKNLAEEEEVVSKLKEKSAKTGVTKKAIESAEKKYKRTKRGRLDLV